MTDVVELAKERRARLATEIAKLDEFIHMAEMLMKYSPGKGRSPGQDDDVDKSGRPSVVRPYSASAGGDGKS